MIVGLLASSHRKSRLRLVRPSIAAGPLPLWPRVGNLLAIAKSPPPWATDRKRAYVEWARAVVEGLPHKPAGLLAQFEEAARLATESIDRPVDPLRELQP